MRVRINEIYHVATDTMDHAMDKDGNILDSGRWNIIHSNTRAFCHMAFLTKVASATYLPSRPDIESIKHCLQDTGNIDYFTHNCCVNARKCQKAEELGVVGVPVCVFLVEWAK